MPYQNPIDLQYAGDGGELTASEEVIVQELQSIGDTSDSEALGKTSGSVVKKTIASEYSLPTASASTLGGVKVGTRLSIDGNGVLSADVQGGSLSGTINEIAYFDTASSIDSLAVATYPSLTELSYVKGVSSAIQTQLGTKITSGGALGTPTSGTLTNCTGLPVAGGGTGVASTTAYAVLCGGTTTTGALQSIASVGDSGQVLTSNGAGALPTFQTASGSETSFIEASAMFEDAARYIVTLTSDGTNTFAGGDGADMTTSATAGSASKVRFKISSGGYSGTLAGSPQFSAVSEFASQGTDYQAFIGVGNPDVSGTAITYTGDQFGFKILRSSSTTTVYATNANGTTETATLISVTVTNANVYHAIKNGTTNIKYYVNGSLLATHTTNLPDSTSEDTGGCMAICNANVATNSRLKTWVFNYKKPVS